MSKDAMTIDGQQSAAVTGPSQESAVGSEPKSVNDIFARRPKLCRCALRAYAVNAAGEEGRKGEEGWLRLNLAATDYAAVGNRCRALGRGDDSGGSLSGALLLTDRGNIDAAIGGDSQGRDLKLGRFVENEGFRLRFRNPRRNAG